MKIPNKIKIGAHVYTVETSKSLGVKDNYGKAEMESLEIFIREDIPQSLKEETLLHEIMHQIRQLNNLDVKDEEEEERIVQIMSHGLYQVLTDNNLLK